MIVNRTDAGWELIYQPAHALVSAQLAARWRADARPPRWWETLIAVSQHDNGWQEWETAPRLNADGTPRNFTEQTVPDAIAQWRRGVARACHQSQWVGLLVSRHATTLFESRRGESAELDGFLDEHSAQQAAWIAALGVTSEDVAHAYAMVRWSDWLSLILCWRRLSEDGIPISVGEGPDGIRYEARRQADETITLSPWPFDEARFSVTVETRLLDAHAFPNESAYLDALLGTPVRPRVWEFAQ